MFEGFNKKLTIFNYTVIYYLRFSLIFFNRTQIIFEVIKYTTIRHLEFKLYLYIIE